MRSCAFSCCSDLPHANITLGWLLTETYQSNLLLSVSQPPKNYSKVYTFPSINVVEGDLKYNASLSSIPSFCVTSCMFTRLSKVHETAGSRSFRPMSCSPRVARPQSRFARNLKSFRPKYEVVSPGVRVDLPDINYAPYFSKGAFF